MNVGIILLLLFAAMFIMIGLLVSKKSKSDSADDFLVAGRSVPPAFVAASVVVSWTWVSTIMGAGEAGTLYGVSGGLNYAWGAAVPFFLFVPMALRIKKLLPNCTTFVEFIEIRYGKKMSGLYLIFGIALCFYILMSQAVGIGVVFRSIFGLPYIVGMLVPMAIIIIYIASVGLRGAIINDVIQFFIITIILIITIPLIIRALGLGNIYNGLVSVATDSGNAYYNPEALSINSYSGFQYGLAAVVVAFGQVLLDQGYYSKAVAIANNKSMLKTYILATVLTWVPIPIIAGNFFGTSYIGLWEKLGLPEIATGSEAAATILKYVFGGGIGSICFVFMVFMAAMTTAGNSLSGAQALLSVNLYKGFIKKDATDKEQLRFGRIATVVLGVIVAVVALFLANVSLLTLDIFSGILFSAPVSGFFAGLFLKKPNEKICLISVILGWVGAVVIWFTAPNSQDAMFYGNMGALLIPVAVLVIGSLFAKRNFNFDTMSYDA